MPEKVSVAINISIN